jgi:D-alanyl-D-alanine carboxypeptidase
MNARAAELGLIHTHFVNPHGLDAPEHVSSAADLLTLTREALRHPAFARIVATQATSVRGHNWENRNRLLGQYPGADGIKTGTTNAAGECLVASASRDDHRLIAVVLGSDDRYADATVLLDYGFANHAWVRLDLPPGDFRQVRRNSKEEGLWLSLGMYGESWVVLSRWQGEHVRSFLHLRDPLPEPGSDVPAGILEFTLAGQWLRSQPVFALAREVP